MRFVVNGEATVTVSIDIREGAVWEASPFTSAELGHAFTITVCPDGEKTERESRRSQPASEPRQPLVS
jgi:hypothetical protein